MATIGLSFFFLFVLAGFLMLYILGIVKENIAKYKSFSRDKKEFFLGSFLLTVDP
jgi:hypothetical protein